MNKGTINAHKGHHPEKTMKQIIRELYPVEYAKLIQKIKVFLPKIDFETALAAYVSQRSPVCKVCNANVLGLKSWRTLTNTCSKECSSKQRVSRSVKTKKELRLNGNRKLERLVQRIEVPLNKKTLTSLCKYAAHYSTFTLLEAILEFNPSIMPKNTNAGNHISNLYYYLLNGDVKRCVDCGEELKRYGSARCKGTCASSYSIEKARDTVRKANNGKVGLQIPKVMENFKKVMLQKHGVEFTGQSESLRKKMEATCFENNGVHNMLAHESVREKNRAMYADPEWLAQRTAKTQATYEANLGPEWRSVFADQMAKSRYKFKDVTLKGKAFKVQGYEPLVLQELVARKVKVKDISTYSRSFKYENPNTGRTSSYRPDIIVDSKGWIIEVKSTYTSGLFLKSNSMWRALKVKSKAVTKNKQQLILALVDPKSGIFWLKDPHRYTRKQVKLLIDYKPFTFK